MHADAADGSATSVIALVPPVSVKTRCVRPALASSCAFVHRPNLGFIARGFPLWSSKPPFTTATLLLCANRSSCAALGILLYGDSGLAVIITRLAGLTPSNKYPPVPIAPARNLSVLTFFELHHG